MNRAIRAAAILAACAAFPAAPEILAAAGRPGGVVRSATRAPARADVAWEPNVGQAEQGVLAVGRGAHTTVLVEAHGAVVLAGSAAVRMTWTGAGGGDAAFGPRLRGVSHYFVGRDASSWRRGVPHHADVSIGAGAGGASVTWTSRGDRPAYDFRVPAGVDAAVIELAFQGAAGALEVAPDGSLRVPVAGGTLRHGAPIAFEETENGPRETPARWVVRGPGRAGFAVARSRTDRALVIDPELDFATFLGGTADDLPRGIAMRADGKIVVAGWTASSDFPTKAALQPSAHGNGDAYVTVFDPVAREIVWSTYLGGSASDGAIALVADGDDVVVGGSTRSSDFPVVDALDSTFNSASASLDDGFLARIAPDGASLAWSTFVGGAGTDFVSAVALAADGSLRAAGRTTSSPAFVAEATASAGASLADAAWVASFAADGSRRDWMFALGPSATPAVRLAIAPDGDCVLAGAGTFNAANGGFPATAGSFGPSQVGDGSTQDAFVARIKADGTGLRWAGLLGGGRSEEMGGIATDAAGNVLVAGSTTSDDFPVTAGAYQTKHGGPAGVYYPPYGYGDAFLAKIPADGSALTFATYFGGRSQETCTGLAVGADGVAVLLGTTWSADFPIRYTPTNNLYGAPGLYAARISPDGAHLLHSLGWGYGHEYGSAIALDAKRVLVAGSSTSPALLRMGAPQPSPTPGGSAETIVARWDPSPSSDIDLTATLTAPGTAHLRFYEATDAAFHRIERRRGAGAWETLTTQPLDTWNWVVEFDDVGLVAPDEYRYRVVATNDVSDAPPTNEARVETVPATPADVAGSAVSARRVDVAWTDLAQHAIAFEVSRTQGAGAPIVLGTTSATTFVDETAWPDRTYTYSVRAQSVFAWGASSAPVPVATPKTLAVSVSRGSIALSPRAGRDAVRLRGTLVALSPAPGEEPAPLDFVHAGLVLRFGDRAGPKLMDALPDDARWRRGRGRITWTGPGRPAQRAQFRFDPATGAFELRVRAAELAPEPTASITIVADSVLHSGAETAVWQPSRRGFVLGAESGD